MNHGTAKRILTIIIMTPASEQKQADFENAFHQHWRQVYNLLFRLTGDQAEAEDWRWKPSGSCGKGRHPDRIRWADGCTGWQATWATMPCAPAAAGWATSKAPDSKSWRKTARLTRPDRWSAVRNAAGCSTSSPGCRPARHSCWYCAIQGLSYQEIAGALGIAPRFGRHPAGKSGKNI